MGTATGMVTFNGYEIINATLMVDKVARSNAHVGDVAHFQSKH